MCPLGGPTLGNSPSNAQNHASSCVELFWELLMNFLGTMAGNYFGTILELCGNSVQGVLFNYFLTIFELLGNYLTPKS